MPGRVARNHGRKALLGVVAALALTSVPAVAQQPPGAPSPAVSPPAGTLPGGGGSADLRIDLDVDHRGSDLEDDGSARFDATVVNNGPGVARDVQVVVSTPKEFNLNEVNHEAECEHNPGDEGRMVCRYGDLAPGAELRLRFRGDFHGDGRSWTHVFVRSASMDPDPGNNHAREEVTVEKEESQDDDFDGDRVTGEFTLRDPDEPVHSADAVEPPSVGGDFEIDARSGPNGEDARGRYSVRGTFAGTTTFDAKVRCLRVDGNVAIVGTEVTRSESASPRKGETVLFRFEDNGEPGAGRDRFFGQNIGNGVDAEESCALDPAAGDQIDDGNIDVRDR